MGDRELPSLLDAAGIYPGLAHAEKVITLEGQLRSCIEGGLAGTPPELGSPDLVAITAYLGSIAKGQRVEIGEPRNERPTAHALEGQSPVEL